MFLNTLFIICFFANWNAVVKCLKTSSPQMGWNSWNKFACNITEDLIKETADALVSTGLSSLGYNYINLDDCWQAIDRDEYGYIQADKNRFPSGIKALSDYVHSKGLKFGIYSSAGFKTCQGYPASLGLEVMDASVYAEWGVDYLKYDNCYQDHGLPQIRYKAMKSALLDSGRDIFYSLCEWGRENPAVWASEIGADAWRVSGDIRDDFESIMTRIEIDSSLWRYAGINLGWNDPDMLEVGNGGCSITEYETHFSMWAILKAPLIIGNDLRTIDDGSIANADYLRILSNNEVINVNQDELGYQGRRVWSDSTTIDQISTNPLTTTSSRSDGQVKDKVIGTKCSSGKPGVYEDNKEDQIWKYHPDDGTIQSSSTGHCLHEINLRDDHKLADALYLNRTTAVEVYNYVSTTDCSEATRWDIGKYIGGSIVSRSSGLCLEVAKFDLLPGAQGKFIQTSPCQSITSKQYIDITEHQSWTIPSNTLLNLYQRQCLTIDRDAYVGMHEEIWITTLSSNNFAVVLLNKGLTDRIMTITKNKLQITANFEYSLRNLWTHEDEIEILSKNNEVKFSVKAHGVVMLKLSAL